MRPPPQPLPNPSIQNQTQLSELHYFNSNQPYDYDDEIINLLSSPTPHFENFLNDTLSQAQVLPTPPQDQLQNDHQMASAMNNVSIDNLHDNSRHVDDYSLLHIVALGTQNNRYCSIRPQAMPNAVPPVAAFSSNGKQSLIVTPHQLGDRPSGIVIREPAFSDGDRSTSKSEGKPVSSYSSKGKEKEPEKCFKVPKPKRRLPVSSSNLNGSGTSNMAKLVSFQDRRHPVEKLCNGKPTLQVPRTFATTTRRGRPPKVKHSRPLLGNIGTSSLSSKLKTGYNSAGQGQQTAVTSHHLEGEQHPNLQACQGSHIPDLQTYRIYLAHRYFGIGSSVSGPQPFLKNTNYTTGTYDGQIQGNPSFLTKDISHTICDSGDGMALNHEEHITASASGNGQVKPIKVNYDARNKDREVPQTPGGPTEKTTSHVVLTVGEFAQMNNKSHGDEGNGWKNAALEMDVGDVFLGNATAADFELLSIWLHDSE